MLLNDLYFYYEYRNDYNATNNKRWFFVLCLFSVEKISKLLWVSTMESQYMKGKQCEINVLNLESLLATIL